MELPLAPAAPAIPAIAASHQKAISRQPGRAATRSSLSRRGAASLSLGLAACLRRMELPGKTELGERLCIITGGTSRLGSAIARGLAASGRFQRILLVGRDLDRGQEVVKELKEVGVQASFEAVDLADQAQVAQFCQRLGDRAVHSLVLAAGVTALEEREETRDGLEMHFGVNYLSRFNMVSRLMKNLEKGGTPEDPCKILLCGSSRHRGEPQLGFAALGAALPLALGDMEDLQLQAAGAYRPWKAFGQAALCNVMFTYELQKRLPVGGPVAVSCFDPGPMTTCWHLYRQEENRWLSAGMSTFEKEIFSYFTRLVQAPEQAAEAAISLATAETLPGRHAGAPQVGFANYWENGMPSLSKFPLPWNWGNSYDEVIWGELWQHSQQLLKAR